MHRAFTRSLGFDKADMDRPLIGILNTYSEMNNCHAHFPELVEAVKRGVWQAGGFPLEFPTISLGEIYLTPTSMLWRNLAAMDAEEMIRGNPMDGLVALCGCDKTTPAALMGVASADVPAILVSGGPMLNGHWRGQTLGACTDCRRLTTEYRAGNLNDEEYLEVEENLVRSRGHCMVMGTASTMNSLTEAMGISLPGNGAIPAADSRRILLAESAGRRIVGLAAEGVPATEPAEAAKPAPLPLHLFELLGVLPLVAPPVVCGALVRVAEYVVGGVDFLEAGFGVAVAAGDVGVILAGQFAIC